MGCCDSHDDCKPKHNHCRCKMRTVPNVPSLENLDDRRFDDGECVRVVSREAIYCLDKESLAAVDATGVFVASTRSGDGRWLRQDEEQPIWTLEHEWYFNAASGSDDNRGTTANKPLKTLKELWARLAAFDLAIYNVHLQTDVPDNDVIRPSGLVTARLQPGGPPIEALKITVNLQGEVNTILASGSLSGATQQDATSGANGMPAIASSGTIPSWLPYIGRCLLLPNGNYAMILGERAPGVAFLSPWWKTTSFVSGLASVGEPVDAPAIGTAFQIVDFIHIKTILQGVGSTGRMNVQTTRVHLDADGKANFGATEFTFIQTLFSGPGGPFGSLFPAIGGTVPRVFLNGCCVNFNSFSSFKDSGAIAAFASTISVSGTGFRNAFVNCDSDGVFELANCTFNGCALFTGAGAAAMGPSGPPGPNTANLPFFSNPAGRFVFTGDVGVGIFNAPNEGAPSNQSFSGITIQRYGVAIVSRAILGDGNSHAGLEVRDGGHVVIHNDLAEATDLRITGNDQQIDMDSDDVIPHITVATGVPALGDVGGLLTFAQWEASYSRNAMNLKNGTSIVNGNLGFG